MVFVGGGGRVKVSQTQGHLSGVYRGLGCTLDDIVNTLHGGEIMELIFDGMTVRIDFKGL